MSGVLVSILVATLSFTAPKSDSPPPSWSVFHHAGPGAAIVVPDRLRIVADVTSHNQLWQLPSPGDHVGAEVVFRVKAGSYTANVIVYGGGCINDNIAWAVPQTGVHHVVSEGDCWIVE